MDGIPDKPPPTLRHEPSNMSDYSVDSNSTIVGSPPSPIQHRAGYRRVPSVGGGDFSYKGAGISHHDDDNTGGKSYGLGIENVDNAQQASVQKAPSGSKSEANTPKSTDTLLSPPSAQFGLSYSRSVDRRTQGDQEDFSFGHFPTPSSSQPFLADSEFESLKKKTASASLRSCDPSGM